MQTITDTEIKADIAQYQTRINQAMDKLQALPEPSGLWKQRKRIQQQRGLLLSEITHVQRLLSYATETLTEG